MYINDNIYVYVYRYKKTKELKCIGKSRKKMIS